MHRFFGVIVIMLLIVSVSAAQDSADSWRASADGAVEYNCDTLTTILTAINQGSDPSEADLGDLPLARYGDSEVISVHTYVGTAVTSLLLQDAEAAITLDDVFGDAVAACQGGDDSAASSPSDADTFNIVVTGNVNLRGCAGTTCDIVGQAANGELMTVLRVDGDWYEVEFGNGTAYVASWLTTRGPDQVIKTDEPYIDDRVGCGIAFNIKRGDADLTILLADDRRNDVVVDLYRPNETAPLRVEGQLDKTFIDTGDPYIYQYYRWNMGWPLGLYQLEITLDGKTSKLAWEMEERGDYNIYVYCG